MQAQDRMETKGFILKEALRTEATEAVPVQ